MSEVNLTKYDKDVREVLTAVLPRRDNMTFKEFDQTVDFYIKEMGKEIANSIHLGLICGVSLEEHIENIKRRGVFNK